MSDAIICTIDSVRTRKQPPETLITLAVPQEFSANVSGFLARVGDTVGVAFAEVDGSVKQVEEQRTEVKAEPNELARKLHVDGYFRSSKLWLAMHDSGMYTAQMHFKWLAMIDACARCSKVKDCGCRGDIITHHCPAANAIPGGTRQPEAPRKPLHFYGLRLCDAHHTWAHTSTGASREDKERMLADAVGITADQMKVHMKRCIGLYSLSQITPEQLKTFEEGIGL